MRRRDLVLTTMALTTAIFMSAVCTGCGAGNNDDNASTDTTAETVLSSLLAVTESSTTPLEFTSGQKVNVNDLKLSVTGCDDYSLRFYDGSTEKTYSVSGAVTEIVIAKDNTNNYEIQVPVDLIINPAWVDCSTVMYVTNSELPIRALNDVSSDVVSTLTSGDSLTVIATVSDSNWVKVQLADGSQGYCTNDYLSETAPEKPTEAPTEAQTPAPTQAAVPSDCTVANCDCNCAPADCAAPSNCNCNCAPADCKAVPSNCNCAPADCAAPSDCAFDCANNCSNCATGNCGTTY